MKYLISNHPLIKEYQELLEKINKEMDFIPEWDKIRTFYNKNEPFTLDPKVRVLDEHFYPDYFKKLPGIGEGVFFVKSNNGAYAHRHGTIEFETDLDKQKFINECLEDWADNIEEVNRLYSFWSIDHELVGCLENHIDYIRKKYEDGYSFIIHLSSLDGDFKYTLIS